PSTSPVIQQSATASRFGRFASIESAHDIYRASEEFAAQNDCSIVKPQLAAVLQPGNHPSPTAYALDQFSAVGGEHSDFECVQVGDLVIWQAATSSPVQVSGLTYVAPSYSLGADLVIGMYRTGRSVQAPLITDECIGQFSLLCTTIARPRNRVLLSDVAPHFKPLTARELETLRLSTNGSTAREVAERMGITKRTVDAYVQSSMAKLQCATKAHVIVRAMRLGLI
ncbi:MAG: response regulator transcription factor, partial [Nevskiaceae bacterium]